MVHILLFLVHGRRVLDREDRGTCTMRIWGLVVFFFMVPLVALADVLALEEFAVFQGDVPPEGVPDARAQIVDCLQATRAPRACIGVTVLACEASSEACALVETAVWERLGFDIYLALRAALGGPDWIDTAHLRLGSEMVARCEARGAEAGAGAAEVCRLNEAASRTLDLRFALVAP